MYISDHFSSIVRIWMRFVSLVAQRLKHLPGMQVDLGSLPGSGRSPGEGNGNPLQYPCLENPMDRGAWQATVHGVAKSLTRLATSLSLFMLKDKTTVEFLVIALYLKIDAYTIFGH